MAVIPQRVALTCCGRTAVIFDYPRLSIRSGNWEHGDQTRDPAGWNRGTTWCTNKRHSYRRTLRAETIVKAVDEAIGAAHITYVTSHSRLSTSSALRRGDIDPPEASKRRRGVVPQLSIPLDSL